MPSAHETLLVDDNEANITLGKRLGMVTARVASSPSDCETAATVCVRGIRDLTPHLIKVAR
jgi:FMN phosphatase YigB (HAD superfamily)